MPPRERNPIEEVVNAWNSLSAPIRHEIAGLSPVLARSITALSSFQEHAPSGPGSYAVPVVTPPAPRGGAGRAPVDAPGSYGADPTSGVRLPVIGRIAGETEGDDK